MKKTLSIIASAGITLALLIACGSGDIIDPSTGSEWKNIGDDITNLTNDCINAEGKWKDDDDKCSVSYSSAGGISSATESSSSVGQSSSSADGQSSSGGVVSSSSTTGSSSSASSSSSKQSSSSQSSSSIQTNVPFDFSCKWANGDFDNVLEGDNIVPSVTVGADEAAAAGCAITYTTSVKVNAFETTEEDATAGITAKAAGTVHNLKAKLVCTAGTYSSDCVLATVSAKPAYTKPTATCSWEVKPYSKEGSSVYASATSATAGDDVRAKYTVTDPLEGCSAPTFTGTGTGAGFAGASAGDYSPVANPTGNVVANNVKVNFACHKDRYQDTTYVQNCPALTVAAVPKPTKAAGGSIKLDVDYDADNVYYIGGTPAIASNTVTYTVAAGEQENCAAVRDSIVGNTDAAGTNRVKAYAIVKCRNVTYLLDSARANVVADPTLTGTCAWDTKNNTFGGGVTAVVKTGFPTTATNSYGRCGTPYLSKDGGMTEWDKVVDAWVNDPQKMEDIGYYADCGTNGILTGPACPDITVKDPTAMCEYVPSICGNVPLSNVKGVAEINISGAGIGAANAGCIFVTDITNIGQNKSVNGSAALTCGDGSIQSYINTPCSGVLPEKIDGGYYIYSSDQYTYYNAFSATNSYGTKLHPNCEAQK